MDAQFYRWIRDATDEQLQQLLSTVNLELQTRQALRASSERELTDSLISQWQRCPVRCHQPCSECGSNAVSLPLTQTTSLPMLQQGIIAAAIIGAVQLLGSSWIPPLVHISDMYSFPKKGAQPTISWAKQGVLGQTFMHPIPCDH